MLLKVIDFISPILCEEVAAHSRSELINVRSRRQNNILPKETKKVCVGTAKVSQKAIPRIAVG